MQTQCNLFMKHKDHEQMCPKQSLTSLQVLLRIWQQWHCPASTLGCGHWTDVPHVHLSSPTDSHTILYCES